MLIPTVPVKEFKKFGFKKCVGEYGKSECYYLCVARGTKMLFVSNKYFDVNAWRDDDPRIHKKPNCRYRDKRTYLDIIYELIKAGMLKSKFDKYAAQIRSLPEPSANTNDPNAVTTPLPQQTQEPQATPEMPVASGRK